MGGAGHAAPFPALGDVAEDALPTVDVPRPSRVVDGQSRVIQGLSGTRLEGERIRGGAGLTLRNCHDLEVVGFDIAGSKFSGLSIDNCQRIRVLGGFFHDNGREKNGSPSGRIGHGIHLTGECEDVVVAGVRCSGNFEDGVQSGNNFKGVAWLMDCGFSGNMENGADQKGGTLVHVRPDYRDNGDGRGMEAIVVHNHAAECRVLGGRLKTKDDGAACINVSNGASVLVAGTVLDASGTKSFCVEAGKGAVLELRHATLIGGVERPLLRVRDAKLTMDACLLHSDRSVWMKIGDEDVEKNDILSGIQRAELIVRNCRETDP